MAYQNKDTRVVPEAIKNITLQPQAAPVDKLVEHQIDVAGAARQKANFDALAKLGQGLMDYDIYLREKAFDDTLVAYEQTEAVENKKQWADVSRNVQGMAKFNPYIKDSYRTLVAQDIYQAGYLKLHSNPNLAKMSKEQFTTFVNSTKDEMFKAFSESEIDPHNYASFVNKFAGDVDKLTADYTVKNSEYTYNNSLIKYSNSLADSMGVNLFNTKDTEERLGILQDTLNTGVASLIEQGVPNDDVVKVIGAGLKTYMLNNKDNLDRVAIELAVKDLKIGDTPISDIVPNYAYEVHNLSREISKIDFEERKADYEEDLFARKVNLDDGTKEFFAWYKNNSNASPAQIQQQAMNIISKYDIDPDGLNFLQYVGSTRGAMANVKTTISDPLTLSDLNRKLILGMLKREEIEQAIFNNQLSTTDSYQLFDRLSTQGKSAVKTANTSYEDLLGKIDKKDGIYYSLRNNQVTQDAKLQLNQQLIDLDKEIEKGNYKAIEDFRTAVADVDEIMNVMIQKQTYEDDNVNLILSKKHINSQELPSYNYGTASESLKNLAFIRGGLGQKIKGNITSGIKEQRTINGVTKRHIGYDIGAVEGTPVYNTNMKAKVVKCGNNDSMGNFVVLEYANGYRARFLHLKNDTSRLMNREILPNQRFSYVGNTGESTGSHLHVDFWKGAILISVNSFESGLKR